MQKQQSESKARSLYAFLYFIFKKNQFLLLLPLVLTLSSQVSFTSYALDAEALIAQMTDEEILGQTLFIGYEGSVPSSLVYTWIKERHVGGIKLYGWNGNDLPLLTKAVADMQKAAKDSGQVYPLFIATDQEGGMVRHIRGDTAITPGNMAIAAGGRYQDAYETGKRIATELRLLGINMNFAPTVDVYVNPEDQVIGPRSFSGNPIDTAMYSLAFFHGQDDQGIISTAKHFPGHGNAAGDSHVLLPVLQDNLKDLEERDLIPYEFLIDEGLPAIMSGHLSFPNITKDEKPATLSEYFAKTLLRDVLGFKGILIADDLNMQGISTSELPKDQLAVEALKAGNDMILLSGTPQQHEKAYQNLIALMKRDEEFNAQIRESALRILMVKAAYLGPGNTIPLEPDYAAFEKYKEASGDEEYFFDQATRSITAIGENWRKINPSKRTIFIGQLGLFFRAGLERMPGTRIYDYPFQPANLSRKIDRDTILSLVQQYDQVVFCLANPGSLQVLKTLEDYKDKIIVLSALTPIYIQETPWIESGVAVYGWGLDSFRAGFGALLGDFTPQGELPIQSRGE
jgi:beta-N-acetylhexosaminidase